MFSSIKAGLDYMFSGIFEKQSVLFITILYLFLPKQNKLVFCFVSSPFFMVIMKKFTGLTQPCQNRKYLEKIFLKGLFWHCLTFRGCCWLVQGRGTASMLISGEQSTAEGKFQQLLLGVSSLGVLVRPQVTLGTELF